MPHRPRHRYEVTDAGREALPVLHSFAAWARKHTPTTPGTDLEVYCRGCGAVVTGVELRIVRQAGGHREHPLGAQREVGRALLRAGCR
ncbi:hypothetical protein [Gryllotalpicola koreensis]|uniref:hypothetical protein n=1 Tax=Gryllotalpicola koreensis TaxID=993086 RepID=UPI0031E06FD1